MTRKLSEKAVSYASLRWRQFATAQVIVDEIADKYGIEVHKQAIQNLAQRDRKRFPARTPNQKREMISAAMRGEKPDPWDMGEPKKKTAGNDRDADIWG